MLISRLTYELNTLEEKMNDLKQENASLKRKIYKLQNPHIEFPDRKYEKEIERELKREDRERYEITGNWLFR